MKKVFMISVILSVIAFAAAVLMYPLLPESIPIHWDVNGVIDGYGSRPFIFLMPGVSLLLTLGLYCLPVLDPKGGNIRKSGNSYPVLMAALNLMLLTVFALMAAAALGWPAPADIIILSEAGVLMLLLGKYLPRIRPNYSFGIRLPWTLASEPVWIRAHRFGGRVCFAVGIVFLIGIFLPAPYHFFVSFAGFLSGMALIMLYAYREYKKELQLFQKEQK